MGFYSDLGQMIFIIFLHKLTSTIYEYTRQLSYSNYYYFFLRLLKMTIHDQLDTVMCLSCFGDSFEEISLQKII